VQPGTPRGNGSESGEVLEDEDACSEELGVRRADRVCEVVDVD
jgi:hypothetical protein